MKANFQKYDEIMAQLTLSQAEYEDLTDKCKNLMQILEMSFEDLGKEIELSKATIDRILNKAPEGVINLTLIARITKIYNLLIEKAENKVRGTYKGLKTLLEEKTLTFNNVINIKPTFFFTIKAIMKEDIPDTVNPTFNSEEANLILNKYKENGKIEKVVILVNEPEKIPNIVIGAKIPGTFSFYNSRNKVYSYQIVYDSSQDMFLLFEVISVANEDKIIPIDQVFECNFKTFKFLSDLLGYIRNSSSINAENNYKFHFLTEELKDYLGSKYK